MLQVGRSELAVVMERMHEGLAKLAESSGGINEEVDAVFSSLGNSVQGLKATMRRELAAMYTRMEAVSEQNSIPKVVAAFADLVILCVSHSIVAAASSLSSDSCRCCCEYCHAVVMLCTPLVASQSVNK